MFLEKNTDNNEMFLKVLYTKLIQVIQTGVLLKKSYLTQIFSRAIITCTGTCNYNHSTIES
jgi:hypothetical protein